jgi:2-aminoethylphosphonate-pyruvate transaminase
LFERRAPEALLEAPAADAVLVSGFTGSRDEVWAYAQSGDADRLALLTKARSSGRGEPAGEFVGLSRFSAGLVGRLAAASEALPAAAHYEDGLNAVCAVHPVTLLRIPDLVWCEIDDAGHLQRARAEIWPRVAAADSRRSEPAAS